MNRKAGEGGTRAIVWFRRDREEVRLIRTRGFALQVRLGVTECVRRRIAGLVAGGGA